MKLMIAFATFIAVCFYFNPDVKDVVKETDVLGCENGDTIKVVLHCVYWRNGDGIPYQFDSGSDPGYGFPMEIEFWTACDGPCGNASGDQKLTNIYLFEGDSVEVEIVVGWTLGYGFWYAPPSVVQGQPSPLGRCGRLDIRSAINNNFLTSISACPVDQCDCADPSQPCNPAPDINNYTYTWGGVEACKSMVEGVVCVNY